ncbi:MAG: excalibur calcium-binding domain-containing protein [Sphingomonas sp.]|uniref:excalibur calcium-binding domain-containing protein n=1 Tax=Sphingomonas sp. TaxID=28214 RepID=UPI0012009F56|nr:excalibur calcium-binding domain-containing protein [Sphingomonas sp.]THD38349.1 MAG: excalibur calcium-binding domain-containing protein [Sphingomonas sp.]
MGEPYPNFRRAQREGGPYRPSRRRRSAPSKPWSAVDIVAAALTVGAITFLATPTLQSVWRTTTMSSAQIEATEASVYYAGCNEARAAGAAPIYRGSPGYRPEMDGDGDGIACEPHR